MDKTYDTLLYDVEINDYNLFENYQIFLFKNQSEGQILSVCIKNILTNDLVVFDGGRIEDAQYLFEFIKINGGEVKYLFITHIHDDHLGSLYEICNKYKDKIKIDNICYEFLNYNYLYPLVGDEIGSMYLFNKAINEYIDFNKQNFLINNINSLQKNQIFNISNLSIEVLNRPYKIAHDTINNSSIVYKAYIENKQMIVLGDLSYYGGIKLLDDYKYINKLKSDIVVLAHHGQNGVDKSVYEAIKPKYELWPTSKTIYENKNNKYKTNETKEWMSDLDVVNIVTAEKSQQ